MNNSRDIAQSAALMLVSQVFGLAISLVTTVFIARTLGEGNFGVFTSLIASVALLAIVPDFGLSPIIVRELVQNPALTDKIVGTGLVLRFVLFLGTALLFNAVMMLLHKTPLEILLINIVMVNILISSKLTVLRNVFESVFRARLRLAIPLGLSVLDGVLLLFFVVLALHSDTPLTIFVALYTLSNVPGFFLLAMSILRKHGVCLKFDSGIARRLLMQAFPVFLYVVFITVYGNVDILLLRHFSGDVATGVYAAALRLSGPLAFISNSITVALYPSLSQHVLDAEDRFRETFQFGMKVLMVAGVTVALFGYFSSRWIISVLYGGRFEESGPLLQVLLMSPLFSFLSFFLTHVNTALSRQLRNTVFAIAVCVLNIGLNLFLIPNWSGSGAAIARLSTEVIGFVVLWFAIGRTMRRELNPVLKKLLLFAVMLFLFLSVINALSPIVFLSLGTVGLVVILFSVRVFSDREMKTILAAFKVTTV